MFYPTEWDDHLAEARGRPGAGFAALDEWARHYIWCPNSGRLLGDVSEFQSEVQNIESNRIAVLFLFIIM